VIIVFKHQRLHEHEIYMHAYKQELIDTYVNKEDNAQTVKQMVSRSRLALVSVVYANITSFTIQH